MLTDPGRYDYLPLIDRPKICWPNGARVAFWVAPNIEFYELNPPDGQGRPIWPRPYPDTLSYSQRDYGNRSGVWRVFEALERYGVRASVSLNAAMCDHMPEIIDECLRLKWELFSHGIYNTRLISGMSEDEVRAVIKDSVETIRRHSGVDVVGWLAPAISATETFFDLLPASPVRPDPVPTRAPPTPLLVTSILTDPSARATLTEVRDAPHAWPRWRAPLRPGSRWQPRLARAGALRWRP